MHLGRRIVDVACVVDAAAFNHEEEALIAIGRGSLQGAEGGPGHLAEARIHIIHVATVQLKGHIAFGKEPKNRKGDVFAVL